MTNAMQPPGDPEFSSAASPDPALRSLNEGRLAGIRYHWGSAYDIQILDGLWTATHRTGPDAVVMADATDHGLRRQIRADYDRRTVRKSPDGHP